MDLFLTSSKMETTLNNHDSIKNGYVFKDMQYKNYMITPISPNPDLFRLLYTKPPFVNLISPIKMVTIHNKQMQITKKFAGLVTIQRSHFRRFYETVVMAVEFLAHKNLYHPEMWNRHAFWVYKDSYYIPSFTPAESGSAHRSLKDAFILACNLIFNIGGITFTELQDYIVKTPEAMPLKGICDMICNFDGNFDEIYTELRRFKHPFDLNLNTMVSLAGNPAEKLVQQCVLRSMRLID